MTDPVRWRDGVDDAPDGALDVLRYARRTRGMTGRERVAIGSTVAALGAARATTSLAAMLAKLLSIKSILVLVVAAAGLSAVGLVRSNYTKSDTFDRHAHMTPRPSSPIAAPVAERSAEPVTVPVVSTPVTQDILSQQRSVHPAPRSSRGIRAIPPVQSQAASEDLAREVQSLEHARLLLSDHPSDALDLLDRAARTFSTGSLIAEREYLAIDALRRLHREQECHARASRFLTRFPESPYATSVRRALDATQ